MKNVSLEMSTEALVAVAILFSLETEGVSNEDLVTAINAKIDSVNAGSTSRAKAKWFENEGAYPYTEGQTVQIVSGPGLINRFAEVIRPSSKQNAVKAFLLKPSTGERQGTLITLDFENIQAAEFVATPVKDDKKEDAATPVAEEAAAEDQVASTTENTGSEQENTEEAAV